MNSNLSGRALRTVGFAFLVCLCAAPLASARGAGRIAGVVLDSAGTPQMGASVRLARESALSSSSIRLLTDDRGRFSSALLPAGLYSIQVRLAGFFPAIERNIEVHPGHPTMLQIMLGTVFSSLQTLRRPANETVSADDWTWVLRSSEATRSVLRWQDAGLPLGTHTNAEAGPARSVHGGLLVTAGADRPGSVGDVPNAAATAVVYDVNLGARGHLLMAGQFSYEDSSSSAGIAGELLPRGGPGTGPLSTLLVRETRLGPSGPIFRGLRITHDDQFMVGDRVSVRYGAELLMAGFDGTTSAVRPHGEVAVEISPTWQTSLTIATRPFDDGTAHGVLQSAASALDAFPTLLLRHGEPVFEDDLHEELAVKHQLGPRAEVTAAVFHDSSKQTGVIGRGHDSGPDFLQDYFSPAFAYDAGASSSTGARLAYRQRFSKNWSATFVYAYAGALAPLSSADAGQPLRERLATRYRQSLAARLSTRVPLLDTHLIAGYKWLDGPTVSRQDAYGESLYHTAPYLSMEIRQPLPNAFPCHMEVQAEVGNLLAQGYIPVATREGYVVLVPSYRFIRGGLSFRF